MDDFFHSVEFYTLALLVAFALLALIFGQREQPQASTYIKPLELHPGGPENSELTLSTDAHGKLQLQRTGLMLNSDDTVNLVATVAGNQVSIAEKKGLKGQPSVEQLMAGTVVIDFLKEQKYVFSYESEVSGQWRRFSYVNKLGNSKKIELKY